MKITPVFTGFDYASASYIDDIRKNIQTLLGTAEGTVPGDRHFGIRQDFVGMPTPIAQNEIALEIIEKIDEYEPRVAVEDVTFQNNAIDGFIEVFVLLENNEDYEEEEEVI